MKIVNTCSKVISIGDIVLMPDKDMSCTDAIAELPAVKAFVNAGFLRIDNSEDLDVKAAEKSTAEKKTVDSKKKSEFEAKAKSSK